MVQVSGWRFEQAQAVWFCVGAIALCLGAAWGTPQRRIDPRPWAALAAFVLTLCLWHHPDQTLGPAQGYFHLFVLLAAALYVLCGVLAVWVIATYATAALLPWLFLPVVVLTLLAPKTPTGWLWTPSQTAFVLALAVPLLWGRARWLIPIMVWQILTLRSYSSLVALGVAGVALLWLARRWAWAVAGTGALALWCAVSAPALLAKFAIRTETWPMTWREWQTAFWFGHGPETGLLSPMIQTSQGYAYRHQDLLAGLRDFGVFLLLPLGWCAWHLWRGATLAQRYVLLVMGLVMSVQTQVCFPRVMVYGCALLGWCLMREDSCSA